MAIVQRDLKNAGEDELLGLVPFSSPVFPSFEKSVLSFSAASQMSGWLLLSRYKRW